MTSFIVFMCVLAQFLASCGDWFLTYWVNKQDNITEFHFSGVNSTPSSLYIEEDKLNLRTRRDFQEYWDSLWITYKEIWDNVVNSQHFDIYLFTAITVAVILITLGRTVLFFNVSK